MQANNKGMNIISSDFIKVKVNYNVFGFTIRISFQVYAIYSNGIYLAVEAFKDQFAEIIY